MTSKENIVDGARTRNRSLLYILIALALCIAWPTYKGAKISWAIHRIESRRGRVVYAPNPEWIRKWIGDRHLPGFGEVTEVYLPPSPQVTNDDLKWLTELPSIRKLSFGRIFIEKGGVSFMIDEHTPSRSVITDDGLVAIGQLHALEELSLADTRVGDAGLRHLAGLQHLEVLGLDRTLVTDAGIQHLIPLQNLTLLSFRRTAVTDAGIVQLAALPRLRWLYFERVADDQSMDGKSSMMRPEVMLGGGVAELRKANPSLKVYWGPTSTEY